MILWRIVWKIEKKENYNEEIGSQTISTGIKKKCNRFSSFSQTFENTFRMVLFGNFSFVGAIIYVY